MCGFAGELRTAGTPDRESVVRMAATMSDRGCRFRCSSDTEVVLKAFGRWGPR
ncbi:MAG: hypothetical protein M3Z06_13490 [Actinomycetota bacterium]|nr:hypothetical protein [Actinomycetota bacterium]